MILVGLKDRKEKLIDLLDEGFIGLNLTCGVFSPCMYEGNGFSWK